MKNDNWLKTIKPQSMADSENFSRDNISLSVRSKLDELESEKGKITMTKTRKIRPLIIAAAVAATAAVSMISVNAATDGAVTQAISDTVQKISFYINGEKVEADLVKVGESEEDGDIYEVYEGKYGDLDVTYETFSGSSEDAENKMNIELGGDSGDDVYVQQFSIEMDDDGNAQDFRVSMDGNSGGELETSDSQLAE